MNEELPQQLREKEKGLRSMAMEGYENALALIEKSSGLADPEFMYEAFATGIKAELEQLRGDLHGLTAHLIEEIRALGVKP